MTEFEASIIDAVTKAYGGWVNVEDIRSIPCGFSLTPYEDGEQTRYIAKFDRKVILMGQEGTKFLILRRSKRLPEGDIRAFRPRTR